MGCWGPVGEGLRVPVAQPRNIELNLEALEQLEPAIRAHINMIIAQVENRLN
jgi:hypothetical protein